MLILIRNLIATLRLRAAAIRLADCTRQQDDLVKAYTASAMTLVSLATELERAVDRTADARQAYDALRQQLTGDLA